MDFGNAGPTLCNMMRVFRVTKKNVALRKEFIRVVFFAEPKKKWIDKVI